jgi:antitoxin component YwqK of YwqJK toxin-antitoxin module
MKKMSRLKMLVLMMAILPLSVLFGQQAAADLNQLDGAGKKFGPWQALYPNGEIRYKGQFNNDLPYGTFSYYDSEGHLKATNIFEPGGRIARHTAFAPNGQRIAEGLYVNQQKDSIWRFYSDVDGALLAEESYKDGKREGLSITYYPANGQIAEETHYRDDKKEGEWKKYFENGALMASGFYRDGLPEGEMVFYYPDSTLNTQGTYRNGLKYGVWKSWDEQGNLISAEDYKEKKN